MKKKLLIVYLLLFVFQGFSQTTQDINFKYCKEIVASQKDYSVVTKFILDNNELTDNQVDNLKTYLFEKASIYSVYINTKKNEIYIYHLSQINYEDLKILLAPLGLEFNYRFTDRVNFQYNNSPLILEEK